ncbi:MAG TPA: hypothetical protein PKH71_06170 [Methanoregulaceae archaeon]|nr:hypothetical protein [Burkholderiaceae bacterium]HNL86724.1 hypothetical protein [Methanoregulaceae archaeon]
MIIGIAFGFMRSGKEDKWGLLKWGVIIGIILGIIFGLISMFTGGSFFGEAWGIFVEIVLYVIVFLIGVFIGDMLEGMKKK